MAFIKQIVKYTLASLLVTSIFGSQMSEQNSSKPINYETFVNEVIASFVKEVSKEFGFRCIGTGGSMPNDVEEIEVEFNAYRKATVEEARELEVTLVEKLLKILNSHEKIRPYLREYPFTSHRAEVSINFCKRNHEAQTKNSISWVYMVKNTIYYDIEDPKTDDLVELASENYDDAFKIVRTKLSK